MNRINYILFSEKHITYFFVTLDTAYYAGFNCECEEFSVSLRKRVYAVTTSWTGTLSKNNHISTKNGTRLRHGRGLPPPAGSLKATKGSTANVYRLCASFPGHLLARARARCCVCHIYIITYSASVKRRIREKLENLHNALSIFLLSEISSVT